jgi:hypothetical protein
MSRLPVICALSLFALAGCGDATDDAAGEPTPIHEDSDASDDSDEEIATDSALATLTIGDEVWAFDFVSCLIGGAETGIEGAELNLTAQAGSLELYLAIQPDGRSLQFTDLADRDSLSWMSVPPGPEATISGRSVSATASLVDESNGGEPQPATLVADCD